MFYAWALFTFGMKLLCLSSMFRLECIHKANSPTKTCACIYLIYINFQIKPRGKREVGLIKLYFLTWHSRGRESPTKAWSIAFRKYTFNKATCFHLLQRKNWKRRFPPTGSYNRVDNDSNLYYYLHPNIQIGGGGGELCKNTSFFDMHMCMFLICMCVFVFWHACVSIHIWNTQC